MFRKVVFLIFIIIVPFVSSCVLKQKGTFFGEVNFGTNSNDLVIYYETYDTNYTFYSFQDLYNSVSDNLERSSFSDYFSLNFAIFGGRVYILNRVSDVMRLISVEGKKANLEGVFFNFQGMNVYDFSINGKKEVGFLFAFSESDEAYLYKFGYSLLGESDNSNSIVIFDNVVLTNVFHLEPTEGGFLVFERGKDGRLIVSLFSREGRKMLIDLVQYTDAVNGLFVSSATVLKGKKIVAKFEDPTNSNVSTIIVFDLAKTNLEKVNTINVSSENFSIISSVNDSYVLAGTFKDDTPSIIMFDPMSDFKISYYYHIDLMYPLMFRGFKSTRDGKIFSLYIDFPDNRVEFYYWNVLSRL